MISGSTNLEKQSLHTLVYMYIFHDVNTHKRIRKLFFLPSCSNSLSIFIIK